MILKWLGLVQGQRSYMLWHPVTAKYWKKWAGWLVGWFV